MIIDIPNNMILRCVVPSDHDFLVTLHNDPDVLRNLTHPRPITLEQHLVWWDSIKDSSTQSRRVFCVDEKLVGFTKFYDIDVDNRSCVLGADIARPFHGLGYAKFMWTLMLQVCFDNWDLHRVSLTTAEFNVVGQRVYRGLGFKEEGRLTQSLFRDGKYHDQIMMFLLKEDWEGHS